MRMQGPNELLNAAWAFSSRLNYVSGTPIARVFQAEKNNENGLNGEIVG